MSNHVILTAGGVGSRMNTDIPKQFITVGDKPVIAFTMEAFQKNPSIDSIVVSCLEGWQSILRAYAAASGITKLRAVVPGGATGQESIYNGLDALRQWAAPDDIVIVHDGNRALVSQDIISDSIRVASELGPAVACIPCVEVIAKRDVENPMESRETISRDSLVRTQTPHSMRFGDFLDLHEWARSNGVDAAAAPELIALRGLPMHFSKGDETNFKITTQSDLLMFKALIALGV